MKNSKSMPKKKNKREPEETPLPHSPSFPEVSFITCKGRKNQPKISPLICEQRCSRIKGCREYFNYLQPAMFDRYERRGAKEKVKENSIPTGGKPED